MYISVHNFQGNKIHASIKQSLITRFKSLVTEGLGYLIQNVMVGYNDGKYRTTKYRYKVNFLGITTITETATDNIPNEAFVFVSFSEITHGMDETYLIGKIGYN